MTGGVAVLHVGAATEDEMKRRKHVDDALNATRAAMAEGVVVGGGVALLRARTVLDDQRPTIQEIEQLESAIHALSALFADW